jgi:hypothetical protein
MSGSPERYSIESGKTNGHPLTAQGASKINDEISNVSVRCSAPGAFSKNFEGKASHINFPIEFS